MTPDRVTPDRVTPDRVTPDRVTPEFAIRVHEVTKLYRRTTAGHKLRTLKSALVERSLVGGLSAEESIRALTDVSFTVGRGEALGLLGSNGSGKSTLLKMVAGILRPTRGTIEVNGRTAALIELGAGFHPEISGRENVFINGEVLGLARRQVEERFDDIVEFSGLANFIEEPVKNYSSGMYVRLGFAVAIHTEPEILLVDEVLSVGDEAFAHRCLRRIEEFLSGGGTLLLVSHSLGLIEEICDRAVWLEKGELRLAGHPRRITDAYRQAVAEDEGRMHREAAERRAEQDDSALEATASAGEADVAPAKDVPAGDTAAGDTAAGDTAAGDTATDAPAEDEPEADDGTKVDEPKQEILRWGSGEATIDRVRLFVDGEERYHVRTGEDVVFRIEAEADRDFDDFVFGVGLFTPRGTECWGTNTDLDGRLPKRLKAGRVQVEVCCPDLRLAPGEYLLDVAVHARDGTPYDYRRKLLAFSVTSGQRGVGVYFPHHTWSFSDTVEWDTVEWDTVERDTVERDTVEWQQDRQGDYP